MSTYDVIVIGVGGMGSAALYHLARRGANVLGLEQFTIPHDRGSSHGITRIIRLAYWEHDDYIPLLRRSYELWRELETRAGERLLITTGSIDAGPEDAASLQGVRRVCRQFDLPHEIFSGESLTRRFAGYRLPADFVAVYQPDGGFLLPERCIVAHSAAAREMGAVIHDRERVIDWTMHGGEVRVRTDRGEYRARTLVFTAGAWTGKLCQRLQPLVQPERQVMLWAQPLKPELFQPATFPVFYMQGTEGRYYGTPEYGVPGVKIGKYHHRQQDVDADSVDRDCDGEDERVLREAIRRYFPDAEGPTLAMTTCLFTNTADEHFIIERLPDQPAVVAGGFSGHGFKFCSVVGEVLADLALDGGTRHDISLFASLRLTRREE